MTVPKSAKQFILIGSPVAHSLSPLLHNIFANQYDIAISYKLQEANINNCRSIIEKFITLNGAGINVTAPLKTHVFKDLKHVDASARLAKAVNTLIIRNDGLLHGYNTDGVGLVCDLKQKAISISNSTILILGAGGAVRGILGSLLEHGTSNIFITNRNITKAQQIASDFKDFGNVTIVEPQDLYSINAEIIINATSGTPDYITKVNFLNTVCYDLNYTPKITVFMQQALIKGALGAYNGLGMLVEQAAAAFKLWHNLRPNTKQALEMLT